MASNEVKLEAVEATNVTPMKEPTLAEILSTRLDEVSAWKTQSQVSKEAGLEGSNVLSVVKRGASKLSLNRVEGVSRALGLDMKVLMMPALRQYYSEDVINALRDVFNGVETDTEREVMSLVRRHIDINKPLSEENKRLLVETLKEVKKTQRPT